VSGRVAHRSEAEKAARERDMDELNREIKERRREIKEAKGLGRN
jgi:hypothetical protein